MSIRSLTMYEIECDESGCGVRTGTYSDWSCWADPETAVEDWDNSDNQAIEGKHYCYEHRKPQCVGCEEFADLIEVDGEHWCVECREMGA
jgi:hypothetical protein